jgi:hypothetical protein
MTDPTLDRALLRGDVSALREAHPRTVRFDVHTWLDTAQQDPDLFHDERLMGQGVKWGRSGRTDVGSMALAWLRVGPVDEKRLMVVLPFLAGLWGSCPAPIDSARTDTLVRSVGELSVCPDRIHYWMLLALANALRTGVTDAEPVRRRVSTLAGRAWPSEVQPMIAAIASRALG